MTNTYSFRAGVEAAKIGTHISNSYPFNHKEWCEGYRTIKPEAKGLFDSILESGTPKEKLDVLTIMQMTENG